MSTAISDREYIVRYVESGSDVTSGSLLDWVDDYAGTAIWSNEIIQPHDEMAQLEAIAEAGDERAFLMAQKAMDWERRPPEDFFQAIQLALSVGAYLVARRLSFQGAERYPQHSELQKYARVLAPPKVTRSNLPPDPTLKTNHAWLKTHGDAFRGQWVALRDGQLLGMATSLQALVEQVGEAKDILFTKVF